MLCGEASGPTRLIAYEKAHTIMPLFIDKGFDGFEFKDCRTYALAGLVVEIMGKPKPFFLLRAHNAATEIIPLDRTLLNEMMRRHERLPQFMHLLDFDRWHHDWPW